MPEGDPVSSTSSPPSPTSVSPARLMRTLGTADLPLLIDVRRRPAFEADDAMLPTAVWRDHREVAAWAARLDPAVPCVVYCVHGHQVSQAAAAELRAAGLDARFLAGGIDGWREAAGPTMRRAALPVRDDGGPSRWVTRERPKIDRIACPWFVRRFVDRDAIIHYVEAAWVEPVAADVGGVPFDIPDVAFSHDGERCSFDAFLDRFAVDDPALRHLAEIVRGADTERLDLAPQAAGLLAMSLGLSALHADDDQALLAAGMTLYDALYGWCRFAASERHGWPMPAAAAS